MELIIRLFSGIVIFFITIAKYRRIKIRRRGDAEAGPLLANLPNRVPKQQDPADGF